MLETQGEKWRTAGKGLRWQGKEAAAGEYKQGPDREALDEEKICSWVCEALPWWWLLLHGVFPQELLFGHSYIFSSTPFPHLYI